jgi:hypothetical protein
MTAASKTRPESEPVPNDRGSPDAEEAGKEAAGDILDNAMPSVGGGLMLDVDPRLNQMSETESELRELVESEAEHEAEEGDAARKAEQA